MKTKSSKHNIFLRTIFPIMRAFFYIGLFISFIIIPLKSTTSTSLCSSYKFLNIICGTCGVTRSFSSLMHGKLALAFNYNEVFVLAIFPVFTLLFIEDIITTTIRIIKKTNKLSLLETFFVRCFK